MSLNRQSKEEILTNQRNPINSGKNKIITELLYFKHYRKKDLIPVEGCTELFNKLLDNFKGFGGIDIAFQYTKEGGKIVSHNHSGENDKTDELICLKEGTYGSIGNFENKNGMMRIPSGEQHGGNSYGTWISIKPRGYNFVEENENGTVYEKGGKKFLISRGKISEEHKSLYIKNLLLITLGMDKIDIGKIHFDNLREQNGDFILIGEIN